MSDTDNSADPIDWDAMAESLVQLVASPGYKPAKPKLLAKMLGVPEDQLQPFKKTVKKLVKRGALTYGPRHLIEKPGKVDRNRITGLFRRKAGGFGFVTPAGTARGERGQDVFIPAKHARDAANGDTVLIRLSKTPGRGGQPAGEIIEIIERETHQFVGSYFESDGFAYVQVDGTVFSQPIFVGDPGAKNASAGDKVVFDMVRFPSHIHEGEGVITKVLGAGGAPGVDTEAIICEYNLPDDFSDEVLEDARLQADRFDESIGKDRHDFTQDTVITIDPVDARDFDDAISLVKLENGHWQLGVHIADVSHFVPQGSVLDREAYNRATSVYLPDRVIPMLPEVISNSLASLQPDHVRYTKTAVIEFTEEGVPIATDLHCGAIRSARRFTYEEVDEYLDSPAAWKKKLTPEVHGLVGRMHELAMILRKRRFTNGSLELSMREVKVDLDKDGRVAGAHRVENTVSHQIIEEFMLAANEAVARRLHEAENLFLRRVHKAPDPRKLKELTKFVNELGFETESLESRFELQKLLDRVHGDPAEYAVNYAVLRSLQRAVYSPEEEGHYALASDCYCHFTSPIRRYPDLTVHRLIDLMVADKKPRNDFGQLVALGEHCSERERRAEAAERELTKLKLLQYLNDRVGEEMDAVVTGVEEFGLFVQGIEIPAEGLIHISSLQDDYYRFDRSSHTLTGNRASNQYRLGDVLRVCVAHVDVDRRQLDFRAIDRISKSPARKKSKRPSRPSKPTKSTKKPAKKRGSKKSKRRKRG